MQPIVSPKRILLSTLFLAALTLCCEPAHAAGPPWRIADGFTTDYEHMTIDVKELAPNVYYLHGSGGNTLASIGPDGTLLVDTEYAQVVPKMKAKLAEMHAGPVKFVISTHFHSDHTGGNGGFAADGATIIGSDNCRASMLKPAISRLTGLPVKPPPIANVPTLTFDHHLTLIFNGEEILSFHKEPAHTDGDTIIFFKHANVMHLGDIFVNNLYPLIDIHSGGRIDGYFPVIDEALGMMDDKTIVIPGHGPITDKKQLKAYRDMLQVVRDRVAAQIAKGATLEEIIATKPSAEYDDQYASNRVGPEFFVAMLYQSLTGGKRMDYQPPKQ